MSWRGSQTSNRTFAIRISLLLIAYSSFLYCSLDFTTIAYVTPDLLVTVFTFLAAGALLRIAAGTATPVQYVALGAVLGLGYLAKTPFLFFGLLCLGMAAALARKRSTGKLARWCLAAATFAAIAVPYIWIAIERQEPIHVWRQWEMECDLDGEWRAVL